MTKNEFILQAMISMAGKTNVAKAAKILADAAEEVAYFDVDVDQNPQKP